MKWASMGDDNTAYFHRVINGRKAMNSIPGIDVNGVWMTKPNIVKREVLKFFRSHFSEVFKHRPQIVCEGIQKVSTLKAEDMVRRFSKDEIKNAVFECGTDKAPGPDGFNFHFVQKFWVDLESDFYSIFTEFYDTGYINPECSTSFITLIPKCKNPVSMKDYRPINLIGMISKVISKVLANRIKNVMGDVISESQTAFVKDRYILDGPLILNEVIAWLKRRDKKAFLLKIDFEKAYDNVNWVFLISIMEQMGFPNRWCMWIMGILQSARSSILVNGSPTFEFKCQKGLRQGDSLSPFLFLVVMEALSCVLNKAVSIGEFQGVRLDKDGTVISHLFYADDALILGDWSDVNVIKVARILRCFHICSGLRININKSNLYGIGTSKSEMENTALVLGCKRGDFPFDYLGIRVGANMNRCCHWKKVVDVFEARLSSWKAKLLSIGGRVILIKAVLESIPIYYFSLYKAPVKIIDTLERLMNKFLWSGMSDNNKIHWVNWNRVTMPKKFGGLGIKRLKEINEALLFKWVWRYRAEKDCLWRRVVNACHKNINSWEVLPVNKNGVGCWKTIVKVGGSLKANDVYLHTMVRSKLGNGEGVRFWLDVWMGDCALKDKWPNLFRLENNKTCLVSDRLKVDNDRVQLEAGWSNLLHSEEDFQQWNQLCVGLENVKMSTTEDKWMWSGEKNKNFSVKSVRKLLRNGDAYGNVFVLKWISWVPLKCLIMAWRAEMNRLPTKVELVKRGVYIPNTLCVWCDYHEETSMHVLADCIIAINVWERIGKWCGLEPIYAFEFKDLLQVYKKVSGGKMKRKIVHGVMIVTMWSLWKARNDSAFNGKKVAIGDVVSSVKSLSYLWLKNRSKCNNIGWKDWCWSPLYML
ncbi:putative RNA-directed DNA polymerase [Helianthus debilis subsp. tardiflorus]